MHRDTLTPFEDGKFCWAGDEDEAVMYLPRFRHEDAPLLRKQLKRSAAVALYSWHRARSRQHPPRRAHHASSNLRETLARRFAGREASRGSRTTPNHSMSLPSKAAGRFSSELPAAARHGGAKMRRAARWQ